MAKTDSDMNPNKMAAKILQHSNQVSYGKKTRTTLPNTSTLGLKLEPNGDRYNRIGVELKSIRDDLEGFLNEHYKKIEKEERIRTVIESEARSGLVARVYKTLFGKELVDEVKRTVVDVVEVEVPSTDGSPAALQQLIDDAADSLDSYNSEIQESVGEIDRVTGEMRNLQKEWLHKFLTEMHSFRTLDKKVAQYEYVKESLHKKLLEMDVTDDEFEETMTNYEQFENLLVQSKHRLRDHHISSVLAMNQKIGLRFYERCLDTTKHSALQMVNYVEPFVSIIRQLNITTDNVDKVCQYIGKSLDIAQGTVKLMKEGTVYLVRMVGAVQQLKENPPLDVIETKPYEQNIERHRRQQDAELVGFRREQENLDRMAKDYLLDTRHDGPLDTYKEIDTPENEK
jgi:hypothetical protein